MQKLFRGGTIANTLNDVPRCIKEMIKENYKKIAVGSTTIERKKGGSINLECNLENMITFNPSRVILFFKGSEGEHNTDYLWTIADSKYPEERRVIVGKDSYVSIIPRITSIEGKKIKIYDNGDSFDFNIRLKVDFLAIE